MKSVHGPFTHPTVHEPFTTVHAIPPNNNKTTDHAPFTTVHATTVHVSPPSLEGENVTYAHRGRHSECLTTTPSTPPPPSSESTTCAPCTTRREASGSHGSGFLRQIPGLAKFTREWQSAMVDSLWKGKEDQAPNKPSQRKERNKQ